MVELGFDIYKKKFPNLAISMDFQTGRVIAEHRERYVVSTEKGDFEAEITGNLRFTARSREDFPAVGDWVALTLYEPDTAIIQRILPRYSVIKRQAAGHQGEVQLIAVNIDCALLVQAVDRDFNINRLERYLAICHSSGVSPAILLTKTDLTEPERIIEITGKIRIRIPDIPLFAISSETDSGFSCLKDFIEKGKTYCLLGSSGVGKSTLINKLAGKYGMKTGEISKSTHKGRHVTSHRELVIIDNGGILIDNPGMREVGITDDQDGIERVFELISALARNCKFMDCTHSQELGCAVLEAVRTGELEEGSYENFMKMERERQHYESTVAERRRKDKEFGKMVKNFKKNKY